MAASILKFFGTWFIVTLVGAAILYFIAGSPSMLSNEVRAQYEESCTLAGSGQGSGGSFFDEAQGSSAECFENAERAIATEADAARSDIMFWYFVGSLVPLTFGLLFALQLSLAEREASTPAQFAGHKSKWWVYFGCITFAGIILAAMAHIGQVFDGWGARLLVSYGWGLPFFLILVFWLAYAAGTRLAAPQKMKPSIPF